MASYALIRLWEHLTSQPRIKKKDELVIDPNFDAIAANIGQPCTLSMPSTKPPDIRFDVSSNTIYDVPVTESQPPFFLLPCPPPAIRSYILGPDWESHVTHAPPDSSSYIQYPQGHIPRPNDPLDEANHCLLMKRCGAEIRQSNDTRYKDLSPRQILGWPATGGVWILRLPDILFEDLNREDTTTRSELGRCIDERMELVSKLHEQLDMDAFCEVLKGHGTVFYEVLAHCREVVQLGL